MNAATGSQKHFVSLLEVGDIASSTTRVLTTLGRHPSGLGPSVGDDETGIASDSVTALGPSVGDDGQPEIQSARPAA
jgi:hypothetical protein